MNDARPLLAAAVAAQRRARCAADAGEVLTVGFFIGDPVTASVRAFGAHRPEVVVDALRERLGITSPKKGCDHGQCRACTVLLDGRRANSCPTVKTAGHRRFPQVTGPSRPDS